MPCSVAATLVQTGLARPDVQTRDPREWQRQTPPITMETLREFYSHNERHSPKWKINEVRMERSIDSF